MSRSIDLRRAFIRPYEGMTIGMVLDDLWLDSPTEDGIEAYTCGDCWALAFYLRQLLGGDIVLAGSIADTGVVEDWEHVAVKVGNTYVDVNGVQTEDELQTGWSYPLAVWSDAPTNFGRFRRTLQADFIYTSAPSTNAFASRFAPSLNLG